jgi:hypothetical protein
MNMAEPPSLLRNDLKSNRAWVKVKLAGTKSNRSAIGASVAVHAGGLTLTAPVVSQSSFLSVNDSRLHFGLGDAREIDKITVRWPSGEVEDFTGAAPGALAVLTEGSGKARIVQLEK